jgi:hypothetical protein
MPPLPGRFGTNAVNPPSPDTAAGSCRHCHKKAVLLVQFQGRTTDIYHGPDEYERTLSQFSRPQRLMFALFWYRSELDNGGHRQFYSNSTGIVWKDALEGFQELHLPEFAEILEESAKRVGDSLSLDRRVRREQLAILAPDFADLDHRFYRADSAADLDATIVRFMREHSSAFHFAGNIRRPVLPTGPA